MQTGAESARGLHAIRVLHDKQDFTLDSLIAAAYDSYLPWFDKTIPALIKAWNEAPETNPLKARVAEQVSLLRTWDHRWNVTSVPTSLAVFWGEEIRRGVLSAAKKKNISAEDYIASEVPGEQLLQSLAVASDKLAADFGSWKTA